VGHFNRAEVGHFCRAPRPSAAPKNIELTAYLLIGSESAGTEPSAMPKELDSVVTQLKNAFAFKNYRLLDILALRTRVGQSASTNSAGRGTQIGTNTPAVTTQFGIRSAGIGSDETTIRIDRLTLDSRIPVQTGSSGQFNVNNVGLQADVDIKQGQKVVRARERGGIGPVPGRDRAGGELRAGHGLPLPHRMRSSFSILPSRIWITRWACNAMSCS
jgi:hypothetical protein